MSLRSGLARLPRRSARRLAGDAGMTVIEAVVALSILGLVGSGFAVGLNQTLLVTQDDRIRQQANHLAERELEITRNRFNHADENGQLGALRAGTVVNDEPLPGGVDGQPIQVDGRAFTVTRTQYLITNGNGANPCDGGSAVTYLSLGVNVRVTWLQQGQGRSVDNRTILTPQKGVEGDVGFIAAKVVDAAGQPTNGVSVAATGPGGTPAPVTTVDGCAVFMFSTAGTYTLTLNQPGYVNVEGFQQMAKGAALELGKLKVLPFTYDQSAAIRADFETLPGHSLPTPLPSVTLANSGLIAGRLSRTVGADRTAIGGLWPYPDGYTVWAGSCAQSDPGMNELAYPRPAGVVAESGDVAEADVALAPVSVRAVDTSAVPVAGIAMTAVPAEATGCTTADARLSLGTTGADGVLATSLPGGSWIIGPTSLLVGSQFPTCAADDTECAAETVQTEPLLVVGPGGAEPTYSVPAVLDVVTS